MQASNIALWTSYLMRRKQDSAARWAPALLCQIQVLSRLLEGMSRLGPQQKLWSWSACCDRPSEQRCLRTGYVEFGMPGFASPQGFVQKVVLRLS